MLGRTGSHGKETRRGDEQRRNTQHQNDFRPAPAAPRQALEGNGPALHHPSRRRDGHRDARRDRHERGALRSGKRRPGAPDRGRGRGGEEARRLRREA